MQWRDGRNESHARFDGHSMASRSLYEQNVEQTVCQYSMSASRPLMQFAPQEVLVGRSMDGSIYTISRLDDL